MKLKVLRLSDFRNFLHLVVPLAPGLNFFVGDNGQGKTNFLEAVHLLSRGSSFRPIEAGSLIRQGASRAKISGRFEDHHLDNSVEMVIENGKKTILLNGKRTNSATLANLFPTVLFSPESLSAIKEGPEIRRKVIDELLVNHSPQQIRLLREYTRALKARNRLLKNISENSGMRREQELALESLNKIYLLLATQVTSAKIKAILDIQPYFAQAISTIAEQRPGDISVDYLISGRSALSFS